MATREDAPLRAGSAVYLSRVIRTWLTSWIISIRLLNALRPGEFMVLLGCGLIAVFGISIAMMLRVSPILGLGSWIGPFVALYWIGRRRRRYMDRKARLLTGESVCLDCGYLVNESPDTKRTIDRCPECGSSLSNHASRSRVRLPIAFVFPEIELASSDEQATEWLLAASKKLGWVGRHPFAASVAALVAIALVVKIVQEIAFSEVDPPEGTELPLALLAVACGVVALAFVQRLWHWRMSLAIALLSSRST